jgi:DNA-binding response OmpR family regulator
METNYIKLDDITVSSRIDFLIVEDERATFEIIKVFLDDIGFNGIHYHASTISEAITYLNQKKIDFVITDKGLPDGSGDALLKSIRQSAKTFNNIPLLVLTGRVSIDDQIKSSRLGASAYLTKPFTLTELRDKIIDSFKIQAIPTLEDNRNLRNRIFHLEEEVFNLQTQLSALTRS